MSQKKMSNTEIIFNELDFRYTTDNLYYKIIDTILQAAEMVGLPHRLQLILAQPKHEIITHFPVKMDNGHFKLFKGYRIQHNDVLGPYKGGMRYDPSVTLDHVKALAAMMTIKSALMHLPLGGAKGGVQVNPRTLSRDELRRLTRRFTAELSNNIGPDFDIPAPDVGTDAQIMAWMADTYVNIHSIRSPRGYGVVTGKPLAFGGSPGREKATGQGVFFVIDELLPEYGIPLEKASFSIIGFGNVGSWTARLLTKRGATLRAVGDHTGFIMSKKGIDAKKLTAYVEKKGGVAGFPNTETVKEDEFYKLKVDLFIPAALEQMITLKKAKQLNCRVLVEAANAPLTPEAERYLTKKGLGILPAALCNAGGVTVSYFEWKQNRQAETWDATTVDARLKKVILEGISRTKKAAHTYNCDLGMAVYCAALERVSEVYDLRGIFP